MKSQFVNCVAKLTILLLTTIIIFTQASQAPQINDNNKMKVKDIKLTLPLKVIAQISPSTWIEEQSIT